jgi:hypothetical protein
MVEPPPLGNDPRFLASEVDKLVSVLIKQYGASADGIGRVLLNAALENLVAATEGDSHDHLSGWLTIVVAPDALKEVADRVRSARRRG